MPHSSAEIFFRRLSEEGQDAFSLIDALISDGAEEKAETADKPSEAKPAANAPPSDALSEAK